MCFFGSGGRSRNEAREAFDQVNFNNEDPLASIDDLHLKALGFYDAESGWYDRNSSSRRYVSLTMRWSAIIFGAIGVIVLELAAFGSNAKAATAVLEKFWLDHPGTPPAAIATMLLVIAGLFIFTDRVLLISRNYVQFRVIQFKIESLRADFNANFIEAYAKGIGTEPATLFRQLHTLAAKSLKVLAEEIENETKAWQASFNEGLALLRSRFEKELPSARAQTKKAREDAEKATQAAQPGTLNVKIKLKDARKQDRSDEFLVHVDGATPEEVSAAPGQTRRFSVPPGQRTVSLKTVDGKLIEAFGVDVKAGKVAKTIEI